MKDLGELHPFLGLEVENVKDGILVSQVGYAKKIIERFGLKKSKRYSTPLDTNIKIKREEESLPLDPRLYRAFVGSLIYLTVTSCFHGWSY